MTIDCDHTVTFLNTAGAAGIPNAVSTNTVPPTYDLAGTSQRNAYIGASTNNTNGTQYKLFSGLIDDVRLYNRALSQGEILWLAGNTTPVAKPF